MCPRLMRGSERPVFIYAAGKYYRPDLNFPYSLPRRSNGIKDFENDPPLSSCGIFQSRMAGMCGGHASGEVVTVITATIITDAYRALATGPRRPVLASSPLC